jgi:hypothetical protein
MASKGTVVFDNPEVSATSLGKPAPKPTVTRATRSASRRNRKLDWQRRSRTLTKAKESPDEQEAPPSTQGVFQVVEEAGGKVLSPVHQQGAASRQSAPKSSAPLVDSIGTSSDNNTSSKPSSPDSINTGTCISGHEKREGSVSVEVEAIDRALWQVEQYGTPCADDTPMGLTDSGNDNSNLPVTSQIACRLDSESRSTLSKQEDDDGSVFKPVSLEEKPLANPFPNSNSPLVTQTIRGFSVRTLPSPTLTTERGTIKNSWQRGPTGWIEMDDTVVDYNMPNTGSFIPINETEAGIYCYHMGQELPVSRRGRPRKVGTTGSPLSKPSTDSRVVTPESDWFHRHQGVCNMKLFPNDPAKEMQSKLLYSPIKVKQDCVSSPSSSLLAGFEGITDEEMHFLEDILAIDGEIMSMLLPSLLDGQDTRDE